MGMLLTAVCALVPVNPASAESQPTPDTARLQTPAGLVCFIGNVEKVIRGAAVVDLGEIHQLIPGSSVAVFRSRESHFEPLGQLIVAKSFPAFFQAEPDLDMAPEVGDIVMFVRTVGELGTADSLRDRFLARQKILNMHNNGYNTTRHYATSVALGEYRRRQPQWLRKSTGVTGIIQSESSGELPSRTRRLLEQVDQFRRLQARGIPVATVAGHRWTIVMNILQGPQESSGESPSADKPGSEVPKGAEIPELPVASIQRLVSDELFDRPEQEQAIAAALVSYLYSVSVRDESTWLRLELQQSQFPSLAKDEQYQEEIAGILKILREPK